MAKSKEEIDTVRKLKINKRFGPPLIFFQASNNLRFVKYVRSRFVLSVSVLA